MFNTSPACMVSIVARCTIHCHQGSNGVCAAPYDDLLKTPVRTSYVPGPEPVLIFFPIPGTVPDAFLACQ
jgi:hypothetical protein